jgi:DNA-directed RNA polymerase specialized sigma24 family protein
MFVWRKIPTQSNYTLGLPSLDVDVVWYFLIRLERSRIVSEKMECMSELELDLQDCTARQYAILILREDLMYSWQRCGNIMGVTRDAARELYKRARLKVDKE